MVKLLKKVFATTILFVGVAAPAFAASAYHTYYPSYCTIKVSGYEHWGKAAASTRDHYTSCYYLQAKLKYRDSSNNYNYLYSSLTTGDYVSIVAGPYTDWERAYGRSQNLSYTWYYLQR